MKRKKQTGKVRVVAKAALPTRFGRFTIAGIRGGQSEEAVAIQHGRLRPGKAPLVRVHSRHNAEATYIFMGPASKSSKSTRVLIAAFERNQATVIEVKANIETLLKSLEEPEHASGALEGGL